jgi:pimeloyl-ACP methyl ester carboxylesterase
MYPQFQAYLRKYKPALLAVWGKNDPSFVPAGAEAFKRDLPNAIVKYVDSGHFALETHAKEIGDMMVAFLKSLNPK